jgi:hypothetical protein
MARVPTLASRTRISEDVLFQDLSGEGVLLNLRTGVYLGLDTVGTRVWQLLGEKSTLAEVLEAMLAEYDVTRERCEADLLALVAEMEENGLVALSDPQEAR